MSLGYSSILSSLLGRLVRYVAYQRYRVRHGDTRLRVQCTISRVAGLQSTWVQIVILADDVVSHKSSSQEQRVFRDRDTTPLGQRPSTCQHGSQGSMTDQKGHVVPMVEFVVLYESALAFF